MRKTLWREESARLYDRYEKAQNKMRGHSLSYDPPCSSRKVDGAGPANMSRDLPDKKSQLDLRPFGVGVLAVGHMVMPLPRFLIEASKMFLLVAKE